MPVEGPAWAHGGLSLHGGRYPLAVEQHVLRTAALLVPAVTTATTRARYFALHGLVADEAERRALDPSAACRWLRRAEITLAAVTLAHGHASSPMQPHGADKLIHVLDDGGIDLAEAERSAGYASGRWGFWNTYRASETALGILRPGPTPLPGPAYDGAAVRAGLGDLVGLVDENRLSLGDLSARAHLCLCAAASAPDGAWLSRLLCGSEGDMSRAAASRRETIRLVTRVMETHDIADGSEAPDILAFGDFVARDPVARSVASAPDWQGIALRRFAVGAWRRLWAWLVGQLDTGAPVPVGRLGERFAEMLPDTTVGAWLDALPETTTPSGMPDRAERLLRGGDLPEPERELSILALAVRRCAELTGPTRNTYLGDDGGGARSLGPAWIAERFTASRGTALRDFARDLTVTAVDRAQRVALAKAAAHADGRLALHSRVTLRDGLLVKTSEEGSLDIALRLTQLARVLEGAGIVERRAGFLRPAATGRNLLD